MYKKSIDYSRCTSCMECERICTNSRVIGRNSEGFPEFVHENKCILCGHCLAICPHSAISFEPFSNDFDSGKSYFAHAVITAPAAGIKGEADILGFITSIRSNRYFIDKPLEKEKLTKILDAMVRAPSAGNEQNRNFYVLEGAEKIEMLEQAMRDYFKKSLAIYETPLLGSLFSKLLAKKIGKITMGNMDTTKLSYKERYELVKDLTKDGALKDNDIFTYLKKSQALIIITSGKKESIMHKAFYRGDACISATYGIIAAKSLGLASCWMGLLEIMLNKDKKVKDQLGISENERIDSAISFGYSELKWYALPPRGPVKVVWM